MSQLNKMFLLAQHAGLEAMLQTHMNGVHNRARGRRVGQLFFKMLKRRGGCLVKLFVRH